MAQQFSDEENARLKRIFSNKDTDKTGAGLFKKMVAVIRDAILGCDAFTAKVKSLAPQQGAAVDVNALANQVAQILKADQQFIESVASAIQPQPWPLHPETRQLADEEEATTFNEKLALILRAESETGYHPTTQEKERITTRWGNVTYRGVANEFRRRKEVEDISGRIKARIEELTGQAIPWGNLKELGWLVVNGKISEQQIISDLVAGQSGDQIIARFPRQSEEATEKPEGLPKPLQFSVMTPNIGGDTNA